MANPRRSASVVVSGAASMKKMNQLCAYLTGASSVFKYHPQQGASQKGSHIELSMGNKKTFLAGKSASKQASGAGATLSIDNDVKIVQCFQGLTLIAQTVIVWDSELAQKFVHPGVVVYIAPDESRFEIRVQAIVPTKCNLVTLPLPRIVTHDESTKTGFGKSINAANSLFQDGRQGPNVFVFRGTSQAELNKMGNRAATRPLTDEA